jgi:hypothetical protein
MLAPPAICHLYLATKNYVSASTHLPLLKHHQGIVLKGIVISSPNSITLFMHQSITTKNVMQQSPIATKKDGSVCTHLLLLSLLSSLLLLSLLLSLWLLSLILSQQCVANAYLFLKKG